MQYFHKRVAAMVSSLLGIPHCYAHPLIVRYTSGTLLLVKIEANN